ncbi:glycoside hydrolase family 65 protein [Bacteroides sedimenti]|uniref:Glycosyl hydrolase family 65 n=1 Tax=Bacteroides sedimenti TaxID=2136147 RepID=A0ABM8IES1_9BACE
MKIAFPIKRRIILSTLLLLLTVTQLFAQTDPWIIKADKIDSSNYYGITAANGIIGLVSSPEPFKLKNVVLAGTYDLYKGRVNNFLNSFNLLNMSLWIDGEAVDAKSVSNFKQQLDMQKAAFTTVFDYQDRASVSYTYYSLRQLPFCVLMDVRITAQKDLTIDAANIIETTDALKSVNKYHDKINSPQGMIELLTSTAQSPTGKLLLCSSTNIMFAENDTQKPQLIYDGDVHLMKFSRSIKAGETFSFCIVGSSISSAFTKDPLNEAERLTIFARLEGRDRLIQGHEKAWANLWKSDIQIEGDEQSQQDIHSMLYHLYSFAREGSSFAPSPMGLSGLGYNGHVFWDFDVWMFPVYLVLQPEIAKSLIDYRFERLDAAKRNALSHGFKGAMYPWESALTGEEETPVFALTGPFEHHITGCVALAVWNYYCVTKDKTWLKEKGWPILSATADFWVSRVGQNESGKYDIKNVVCADEWAENVDNNAFTNAVAKANLQYATVTAKLLGIKANPDWEKVAKNIPTLKMPDGVTSEHATYKGAKIKQADVNLLAYPLTEITDVDQIKKDLEYYSKKVPYSDTPAMTQAIFSLLNARLGNSKESYKWFKDAYEPNLNPPFRVIAETKGGKNPYFVTGAGGVVQSVLMGFGGLNITDKGIVQVKSVLPENWKKLTITGVGLEKKTYVISR